MPADYLPRRALIASRPGIVDPLRNLFSRPPLNCWETVAADSFAQARFCLQVDAFDAALVSEELFHQEGEHAFSWLVRRGQIPVVFLGGDQPQVIAQAYQQGAHICLSLDQVLAHPALLATVLERSLRHEREQRRHLAARQQLHQCRRQIDRLVNLIWRATPTDPQFNWLPQRFALERLEEELTRAERHGIPLTVAVGQVRNTQGKNRAEPDPLDDWTVQAISRAKRRGDVAGHYGLKGFLLVMVHTPGQGGVTCCRRLQKTLQAGPGWKSEGPPEPIRAFFGLAGTSERRKTPQALLCSAELNLDAALTGQNEGLVAD